MNTLQEPPSRSFESALAPGLILAIEHALPIPRPLFSASTSAAALVCVRSPLTQHLREID